MASSATTVAKTAGGAAGAKATVKATPKSLVARLKAEGKLDVYRNNPALRGKLPSSALTPAERATRKENAYLAAPAQSGSSLSNRDVAHQVNADATQQYGAPLATAKSGVTAAVNAGAAQPGWFDTYRQAVAGQQQQQAAQAQQQSQSLQGLAMGAGQTAPGLQGDQTSQAAGQIRQELASGVAQLAQLVGNNETDFLKNLGLTSYGQQASAATANQNVQGAARQNLQTVQGAEGAFKTNDRTNILAGDSKAQQQAISNQITAALAGNTLATGATDRTVKVAGAQTAADKVKADAASAAAKVAQANHAYANKTHTGTDVSEGAWEAWGKQGKAGAAKRAKALTDHQKLTHPNAGGGKDAYGNTPTQVTANNDEWAKAKTTAAFYWLHDQGKHGSGSSKSFKSWSDLASFLTASKGLNAVYATAAAQEIALGYVGPNSGNTLKQRGITGFKVGKPKSKATGPTGGTTQAPGATTIAGRG